MKRIGFLFLVGTLAAGAMAQDLENVSFVDQLNSGIRGNNDGSGSFGASNPDGSEFEDYNGSDLTVVEGDLTTSVRYINTWGSHGKYSNAGDESPVLDVTVDQTNPDYLTGTIEAIAANNRPDATDGSKAVFIGDDGGFNALFFGESDDANYFVEADVYCPNKFGGPGFEVAGVVARAARDNDPNMTEYTFNPDRAGSYSIYYDYQDAKVRAVKWHTGNSAGDIEGRNADAYTLYGSALDYSAAGGDEWHTFRIECLGNVITFLVDGTEIAVATDTDVEDLVAVPPVTGSQTHGRPGIYYREKLDTETYPNTELTQGRFDHLVAGRTATATVPAWSLY